MNFILNVPVKLVNIESSPSHQPVLSEYRSITNEFQEEEMHDAAVSPYVIHIYFNQKSIMN